MKKPLLHVVPYGRPSAQLLRERISAAKRDDPLAPVTVVVPTNYVGVSTRRALASGELGPITSRGGGVAGLLILTLYRLAELLGAPRLAAAGRRPVSTPVIAAAVRGVLDEGPGMFAPVKDHPSTEEELVRVHRELSEVTPESLEVLAARSGRAAEVVAIHRNVRLRLRERWYEEADLIAAARQAVGEGTPLLDDLGMVIVHLPQDLSLPAAGLVQGVAAVGPVEVIAAFTGAADADADVRRTLRRLGLEAPEHVEVTPPAATAVVSVSDADEEGRSAVARVIAAARDGVALERMALLYPRPEPYARIVHEHLEGAGVAYSGRAVRLPSDRIVGRWLLDLLELPEERYSRPAVMGLLSEAPVLAARGGRIPAGTWERISREAGIVHGRREWLDKLARFAMEQESLADDEAGAEDPREWLADRFRRNGEFARRLRGFVAGFFDELEAAMRMGSWAELTAWCKRMISRYLGGEARRDWWPEEERDAADRVDEALDRLGALDAVEGRTDLRIFRRTLQLELEDDLGRVGEFGLGVLVGTPSAALGVDLDLVIVMGLAEGVFPTRPREDSLLPDRERAAVADELRSRGEQVGVEHRHLLAALAGAGSRVVTFPRGDLRRSVERAPSRWLLDSVEALRSGEPDGDRRALLSRAPWLETVPSFAARVRTVAFPATRQEYGLRALVGDGLHRSVADHRLVRDDERLRRGVELVRGRQADRFTRFDGNLASVRDHITSPAADRPVSASQLEAWLDCPHRYLMEYLLKVAPIENPEELLEITPLEKGTLIHDVLERWLCELLAGDLPPVGEEWPPEARRRLAEIAEQACRDAQERGVTGHPLLWRRDRQRILHDLEQFALRDDARRRELRVTPVGAELPFGMPRTPTAPVTIDLGDGRHIRVRGKVDRVDVASDGTIVVTDYKTGGHSDYRDLSPERPLGDGTRLQLPIYALAVQASDPAVRQVRTEYWFVSSKGEFKRIGYDVTPEVLEELRRTLRVVVDGIERGLFPARPPEPGWQKWTECRYCDPDELGSADRHRDWERLRLLPELRDYVALVAPEVLDGQEVGG
ncbi:MAG: PD-(D/E)XK nuclease family protein [Nitriliruptorales bacterium]